MGKMVYTRVCADCGRVMHNVGCRRQRCEACAHEYNLRVGREKRAERKAAVTSMDSRQMLLADNARFIASAGSYGKGRLKEYLAAQNKKPAGAPTPTSCGDDGFTTPIVSDNNTFSEV